MSSWHASVSLYSSAYTTLWKNWSRYCFKFQFKQLPTYLIEHNHIGIIFLCLRNSQCRVYKTQSKSDWLFNTQARTQCCNMVGQYRKIVRRQLWIIDINILAVVILLRLLQHVLLVVRKTERVKKHVASYSNVNSISWIFTVDLCYQGEKCSKPIITQTHTCHVQGCLCTEVPPSNCLWLSCPSHKTLSCSSKARLCK